MMAPRKIHADDTRNPSYYERRAGYPVPDQFFYEGRTSEAELRQAVHYTQEMFVCGFDLTCGEFYRFREDLFPVIIEKKLHQRNLAQPDVKWDLYEVYEEALQHRLLKKKNAPPYWRRKMIQNFVRETATWLVHNSDKINEVENSILGLPRDANWAFGPERKSKPFDGYYQYQHMIIQIRDSDSPMPLSINVRDIRHPEDRNSTITWMDIDIQRLSFAELAKQIGRLKGLLGSSGRDYTPKTHIINYRHPVEQNFTIMISDDESLQSALTTLRQPWSYYVEFNLRPSSQNSVRRVRLFSFLLLTCVGWQTCSS
jgi:hypothetical protein